MKTYDYQAILEWFLEEFFLIDDIGDYEPKPGITVNVEKLQKELIPYHYEEGLIDVIERSM